MNKPIDTPAQTDSAYADLRDLLDLEVLLIGGGEVIGSGD